MHIMMIGAYAVIFFCIAFTIGARYAKYVLFALEFGYCFVKLNPSTIPVSLILEPLCLHLGIAAAIL